MALVCTLVTPRVNNGGAGVPSGVDITTASFTPTAGALLVACVTSIDNSGMSVSASQAHDSLSLSWTQKNHIGFADNGVNGYASIWYAVATGSAMTVSCNVTQSSGSSRSLSLGVYQVTGQNATPTGASGTGSNTAQNADLAVYTSTANNSLGICCGTDDNDRTPFTSSDSTIDQNNFAGIQVHFSEYLNATTPSSGTGVTMNVQNGVGGVQMNWAAMEIIPSAGAVVALLGQACL